jgi:hypothetical protein
MAKADEILEAIQLSKLELKAVKKPLGVTFIGTQELSGDRSWYYDHQSEDFYIRHDVPYSHQTDWWLVEDETQVPKSVKDKAHK